MLAGAGAWWTLPGDPPEPRPRHLVSRPLRPHLVVTTVPDGAEVIVDGSLSRLRVKNLNQSQPADRLADPLRRHVRQHVLVR